MLVLTTTGTSLERDHSTAGTRYAIVLPTPVPASTIRWRHAENASATSPAIRICSGRLSYPGIACANVPPSANHRRTSSASICA